MYKDNSLFDQPIDQNCKIWKYMDFTKFVSLLDKNALWFSRGDKLLSSDKFEGAISIKNIINLLSKLAIGEEMPGNESSQKDHIKYLKILSRANKYDRQFFFISSFHVNEQESAAMWKLYVKNNEGIAIQSSCQSLKNSLDINNPDEVFLGLINYIDYESQRIPEDNCFRRFFYKRKSFEHEHELRAIIKKEFFSETTQLREEYDEYDLPYTIEDTFFYPDQPETGIHIPINLKIFIEKIYIAPTSPKWFKELVMSVVKKYEFPEQLVIHSHLEDDPIY